MPIRIFKKHCNSQIIVKYAFGVGIVIKFEYPELSFGPHRYIIESYIFLSPFFQMVLIKKETLEAFANSFSLCM